VEFVILGLLSLRAMTVYEINKALERGVSLFYSASFGSINAAVNRMLEKGWISGQEKVENGRNKRVFHLTPAGRQAFQGWLTSEIEAEKVKDPALTRLYFMGFSYPQERIRVLDAHIQNLRQLLGKLDLIHQQAANLQIAPEQQTKAKFQLLTLQYGRDFYAFNIRWYEALLESLRQDASG
jgi:PadR family transcriptional regulator, regulatory protein AphA